MTPRLAGWVLLSAAAVAPLPVRGQAPPAGEPPLAGYEAATLLFVPELRGAVLLDLELQSRFDGLLEPTSFDLPPHTALLRAGWRHYLEPWGRYSVAGYAGLGLGFGGPEERPGLVRALAGAALQVRGISPDFFHFSLGLFVEAGPVVLGDAEPPPDFPALSSSGGGFAWAFGVETGPGLLFHLDPYVFGEVTGRLAMETMSLGGYDVRSLIGALRFGFDFATRRDGPP